MKMFVYGSLRKDMYNSVIFNEEKGDSEYIGDGLLDGYELYSLGSYPAIYEGDGSVVVELYEVHNQEVFDSIDWMEKGAGYKRKEVTIKVNGNDETGYVYVYSRVPSGSKVEDGDWVNFIKS